MAEPAAEQSERPFGVIRRSATVNCGHCGLEVPIAAKLPLGDRAKELGWRWNTHCGWACPKCAEALREFGIVD